MITIKSIKGNSNLIGLWYMQMLGCGRADKVFYAANHDLEYVLGWAKDTSSFYGAFLDGVLIGVGFTENAITFDTKAGPVKRAEMGFGFLPNCSIFQALKAGRMIVSETFSDLELDHAFGTTPELNKEALAYVRRLGFNLYGPIPSFCSYLGEYTGVYTSHVSRKEWINKQSAKQFKTS